MLQSLSQLPSSQTSSRICYQFNLANPKCPHSFCLYVLGLRFNGADASGFKHESHNRGSRTWEPRRDLLRSEDEEGSTLIPHLASLLSCPTSSEPPCLFQVNLHTSRLCKVGIFWNNHDNITFQDRRFSKWHASPRPLQILNRITLLRQELIKQN